MSMCKIISETISNLKDLFLNNGCPLLTDETKRLINIICSDNSLIDVDASEICLLKKLLLSCSLTVDTKYSNPSNNKLT